MKIKFLKNYSKYLFCLIIFFLLLTNIKGFAQKDILHKSLKKVIINKKKSIKPVYSGNDGPYIINDTLFRVDSLNRLVIFPKFNKDSIIVRADNKDKNEFYFSLKAKYKIPKTHYKLPKKMVVLSDIEGNYEAFSGFLYSNKVIDENHNWIFDDGHLVLVGDFMDRGKNVTQVLWLIYKLEEQAKKNNGTVHFILGNHEILNFEGDFRYNREKYIKAAQEISQLNNKKESLKYMYSKNSELGKWLATKNIIEKIGNYIFVHAGLSPEILNYKLSLKDINSLARIDFQNNKFSNDNAVIFLFSEKGPLWYRGLVLEKDTYKKINSDELNSVLKFYKSEKIVIGHTSVKQVSTDFDGRVIRTDVRHGNKKFSKKTQGLLIEKGEEFIIDANYLKIPLKN